MNIAIFGANGFIGSHLSHYLNTKKNFNVYCFIREKSDISRIEKLKRKYRSYNLKILRYKDENLEKEDLNLNKLNIDIVLNLISYGVLYNENNEDKAKYINIEIPKKIFKISNNNNVKHFIHFGSSQEYENLSDQINELSIRYPTRIYGRTKAAGCDILLEHESLYKNTNLLIIRPFSVFGELENENKLLPSLIKSLINNTALKLTKGYQERNYLYINDFNKIILRILKKIDYLKFNNYNIGSINNITIIKIAKIIENLLNSKNYDCLLWGSLKYRNSEILTFKNDLSRLQKELKINLSYDIRIGIKKLINSYLKDQC